MNQIAAVFPRLMLLLSLLLTAADVHGQPSAPPQFLDALTVRSIGPSNTGGRVISLAIVEDRPATMYVATASGGLWKTANRGTTWTPIFDNQGTISLGAVAVASSNPDVVWVGTGEANARNSVSWGDGVYKSTDGGKTWKNMGLRESHHIGAIVIHPKNPDIVYVAALGHLWGPNKERGLYRTQDGGKTWEQCKYINDETGFIDLAMDPGNPDTLYAAAYRVRRGPFSGGNPDIMYGPESGLYKTSDAGKTWKRLTRGLPDRPIGRCGLAVSRKDPRIVYAIVQTDQTALARENELGQASRASNQPDNGGVFRSADRGETWIKLNDLCPRPFYFSQIRIDPSDDQRIYVLGVTLHVSIDGGRIFRRNAASGSHADHHALWIDPADPDHLILAGDGGVYFSYDRGATWEHVRNLPIGQFYGIGLDMRKPYRVYGGLQDNGSWGGPSRTHTREGITPADWVRILGADGFHCQVDANDAATVYAETQYGGLHRLNVRTGEDIEIRPRPPRDRPAYRFNWSSPILLSPHDSRTIYYGGNYLFRSVDRGDRWSLLSPDLTRGQPGPSADSGHTLTTIAESPLRAGTLWTGSDDGLVYLTRDGGRTWSDVGSRIPDLPPERWITRIECSPFAEGTAFVAIDRHRNDDRAPYLFKTEDYGKTWKALAKNLPPGSPIHVVRTNDRNRDLLFVGTEHGLFVSLDGGARWQPLGKGLPTIAVHDLAIHPRDRELVIATHGLSIYILDISPLEQLSPKVLESPGQLFEVKPVPQYRLHGARGFGAGKNYLAPNPEYGASIWYYLKEAPEHMVRVAIVDTEGNLVARLAGPREPGLHRVQWSLRKGAKQDDPEVPPGEYQVQLRLGDQTWTRKFRVETED
jgi:photosystem II stability/assembly factor-like uncharacterized protein